MTKIPMFVALRLAEHNLSIKKFTKTVQPMLSDMSVVSQLAHTFVDSYCLDDVKDHVARLVKAKKFVEGM